MGRFWAALLCCLLLVTAVAGAGSGNTMDITARVSSDGACRMSVQMTLNLAQPVESVTIPLGSGAKDATVNGVEAPIRQVAGVPSLVLTSETGYTGQLSLALDYTLADCLDEDWTLVLPLLAEGLAYPMDAVSFQITLPGAFSQLPIFTSGYYGADVDNYMTLSISGGEITGTVDVPLRDRESLTFTMETDPTLFPRESGTGHFSPVAWLCALGLALLALLYWLVRLSWKPFRPVVQTQPPVGAEPGELGCKLFARSPDLPLMVLSWARLGYLTIHISQEKAVTLHKRMDMGNERSAYENQLFRQVFGHGQLADTGGRRFQSIRQQVSAGRPQVQGLFRKSGLPVVVRLLSALSGGFLWMGMADAAWGRPVWTVMAGLAGTVAAWLVPPGFTAPFSWDRRPGWRALAAAGITLAFGLFTGCFWVGVAFCLVESVAGLLIVFGGRRSPAGRQMVQSILGFRQQLKTLTNPAGILAQNPNYYYDMAPSALALGVDRQFAARFETLRLPDCPWLVADVPLGNHALEWYPVLRQITQILRGKFPGGDRRQRRYPKRRRI